MNVPPPSTPNRSATYPADLRIRLTCQSVSEFLDQHAPDVSRGGIFVRHPEVLPVGRAVRLNLQLANGTVLLAGEGTVFWTREADPSRSETEPGMGIRFTRLTNETQRMLTHLLNEKTERERYEDGSSDFDQDERTVVATEEEIRAAAESGRDPSAPALSVVSMDADFEEAPPISSPRLGPLLPMPGTLPPPFAHAPILPTPAQRHTPAALAAQSVAAALDADIIALLPPVHAPVPSATAARISAPILPVPAAAQAAAWETEDLSADARRYHGEAEPEFTALMPRTSRNIGVGIAVGAIIAAAACFFLLRPLSPKTAPAPARQAPALIAAPMSAPERAPAAEPSAPTAPSAPSAPVAR